jgi:hypothetical protein
VVGRGRAAVEVVRDDDRCYRGSRKNLRSRPSGSTN